MPLQDQFLLALKQAAQRVETSLNAHLPPESKGRIAQAMRYTALSGGKRLRAFLVMESAALFDVPTPQTDATAAAIECIHAYSLVHDDLPAMDNDDLRRGLPTVHIKWDDATAVLTGDALQTVAFDILAGLDAKADARLTLISSLAKASSDMVFGQDMDIAAESTSTPLSLDAITTLQSLKTGALIRWSAGAGALLASESPDALHQYAEYLGRAFQIRDDILDIEGDAEAAGKRLNKDQAAGKATFVSLLGMDAAKARAVELAEQAQDALAPYGPRAENLRQAAQYTITRST